MDVPAFHPLQSKYSLFDIYISECGLLVLIPSPGLSFDKYSVVIGTFSYTLKTVTVSVLEDLNRYHIAKFAKPAQVDAADVVPTPGKFETFASPNISLNHDVATMFLLLQFPGLYKTHSP